MLQKTELSKHRSEPQFIDVIFNQQLIRDQTIRPFTPQFLNIKNLSRTTYTNKIKRRKHDHLKLQHYESAFNLANITVPSSPTSPIQHTTHFQPAPQHPTQCSPPKTTNIPRVIKVQVKSKRRIMDMGDDWKGKQGGENKEKVFWKSWMRQNIRKNKNEGKQHNKNKRLKKQAHLTIDSQLSPWQIVDKSHICYR